MLTDPDTIIFCQLLGGNLNFLAPKPVKAVTSLSIHSNENLFTFTCREKCSFKKFNSFLSSNLSCSFFLHPAAATSFNSPFVSRERFHTKLAHIHRSFSGSRPSDHIGLVNVNQQFQAEQEIDPTLAENFCYGKSLSYPLLNMTQEAKR